MKKTFSASLALLLMLTLVIATALPVGLDTVSAASEPWVEETSPEPATPAVKPVIAAPTVKGQVYTVVSGDVFWKIAKTYNLTLTQLKALNPQVKNANLIYVGQKLTVKAGTATAPTTPTTPTTPAVGKATVYQGLGYKVNFRNGPGSYPEEGPDAIPVYSFNVAMATATFDASGKIVDVYFDGYEVSTPNYDGTSMPHFSNWPTTVGYAVTAHPSGTVSPGQTVTLEAATAEVNGWLTKRQRGDTYDMNPANEWYKQMNFYQNFFKGKTVAEIKAWVAKYTTAATRPIKASTTNAEDLAKFNAFTPAEKAALADVVSGATMAVNDAHGYFIDALAKAYENRVPVTVTVK